MADKNLAAEKYKHADHVAWRRVAEEVVVLDLNSSAYYSLNEVGAFVWERLGQGQSLRDIATALCEDYDVEEKQARKDVDAVVQDMIKNKILEPKAA